MYWGVFLAVAPEENIVVHCRYKWWLLNITVSSRTYWICTARMKNLVDCPLIQRRVTWYTWGKNRWLRLCCWSLIFSTVWLLLLTAISFLYVCVAEVIFFFMLGWFTVDVFDCRFHQSWCWFHSGWLDNVQRRVVLKWTGGRRRKCLDII